MQNKTDFSAFKNEKELERWLWFHKSYNTSAKKEMKTTRDAGYKNAKKHKKRIIKAMELISKYGNTYFKVKKLSKIENPKNKMSFSAKMRYAIKYLQEIGVISIYHRKTTGRKQTVYKREIDIEIFNELIDILKQYDGRCL